MVVDLELFLFFVVRTGKVGVVSAHLPGTKAKIVPFLLSIRAVEIKPS